MPHDDRSPPATPADAPAADTPASEPTTPRLKTGLRAGARDGRIFEADGPEDLPGEPL